jgi:hypothetical protein
MAINTSYSSQAAASYASSGFFISCIAYTERIEVSNNNNKAFSVINTTGTVSEKFTVYGDGRTVIGGKEPNGTYTDWLLSVNGTIVAKEIFVETSNWADKVFDKSYKLRPLTEVQSYIDQYKHLPEIPSECEVIQNGINIADMNKLLLQKVEELTLYVLGLKKANDDVQAKLTIKKQ